jgi:predicted lipoprotein with Yx(FWY)xxD motif
MGTALVAVVAAYASVAAQGTMPAGVKAGKSATGTAILTDSKGMTLYTFAKDADAKSNCNGQCAVNWPPLMAADDAKPMGDWTIVTRDDGKKMWAYKGKPLYTWVKDQKAGDTTGDGVGNGAWKVAVP